ncbi:MAG: energy transducer TonB [Terracidiphilus sp.]
MHPLHPASIGHTRRKMVSRILQTAAYVAIVALALPVRGGDTRAVKSRVSPVYPEIAKRMHIAGEVQLQVTVDAQGKVKDVKPVSGNHVLSSAAEDAVRQWKYVAGDGDSVVTVTINFALAE